MRNLYLPIKTSWEFAAIIFLIAIFISGCNNSASEDLRAFEEAFDRNDTIPKIFLADTSMAFPELFEASLMEGTRLRQYGNLFDFRTKSIGGLKIPSGKIVGVDPVSLDKESLPYKYDFPKGTYPLEITQMSFRSMRGRNAFARIRFKTDKIDKWEYARKEGQKFLPISDSLGYGYHVQAGIGLFIDQEALPEFDEILASNWNRLFIDNFETGFVYHEFGKYNMTAFHTGQGDGFHSTYIGYNEEGEIVQLLTDLRAVEWSECEYWSD